MDRDEGINWTVAAAAIGTAAVAGALLWQRRRSISFRDRVVIITGGSRGLGLHMARRFAEEGAVLVLLARDERELRRAAGELMECGATDVQPIVADIRNRDEVDAAIELVMAQFGRIDVLVNNAGVIQVGPVEHMDLEDFESSLEVHLWGPLYLSLAVIPHMKRQGEGRIVNISSVGGRVAVPHLLPYSVGKFALVGLSDGLRTEMRPHGIYITTVCPWLMRTGSPPQGFFKGRHELEYAWFATGGSIPGVAMSGERAARKIVEACRRGDASLNVGFPTKIAALLNAVAPELMTDFNDLFQRMVMPAPQPNGDTAQVPGWDARRESPNIIERFINRQGAKANQRRPQYR